MEEVIQGHRWIEQTVAPAAAAAVESAAHSTGTDASRRELAGSS